MAACVEKVGVQALIAAAVHQALPRLRNDLYIEPLSKVLALVAGTALRKITKPSVTVMASAASRGDIVLPATSKT